MTEHVTQAEARGTEMTADQEVQEAIATVTADQDLQEVQELQELRLKVLLDFVNLSPDRNSNSIGRFFMNLFEQI